MKKHRLANSIHNFFPVLPISIGKKKYYANRMQAFKIYTTTGMCITKRSCVIDYYCHHIIIIYIDL